MGAHANHTWKLCLNHSHAQTLYIGIDDHRWIECIRYDDIYDNAIPSKLDVVQTALDDSNLPAARDLGLVGGDSTLAPPATGWARWGNSQI